jgi:hypothetical protein
VDEPGRSQGRTGPKSETSAIDDAKTDVEKSSEEVATEQDMIPMVKAETKIEVGISSQWPPNQTIWFPKPDHSRRLPNLIVRFPKPDHLVSPGSGQKKASRTTMPGTAPTPHWCPIGLTPS